MKAGPAVDALVSTHYGLGRADALCEDLKEEKLMLACYLAAVIMFVLMIGGPLHHIFVQAESKRAYHPVAIALMVMMNAAAMVFGEGAIGRSMKNKELLVLEVQRLRRDVAKDLRRL